MDADPFFQRTESMRMARRDGSLPAFAADSTTSPENVAPIGITVPFTKVAMVSVASTLVPTRVLPAITFCRIVTGNSYAAEILVEGRAGCPAVD